MTPEQKAREMIDKKLTQSGWIVQDRKQLNLLAGLGVAVREFPTSTGPVDYALFVEGTPVGIIEAKKDDAGENITAVEGQSNRYVNSTFKWIKGDYRIRFVYPDLMMKCHTKDGINPQFVIYQLQSRVCKTHFREHATGTSGSMPKINQQTVMTAPIIMTSLEEQERIVKQIEERLSVCDSIEKTVDAALLQAEAMRQSILKQAFEGRL